MRYAAPILLATVAAALAAPTSAGDASAHMAVSLSVTDGCSISATPMEFAMESDGGALAQASVALACSPRTTYEIAIDRGDNASGETRQMADPDSGALVEYEVYRDAARTARWGDRPGSDTVGGRVESAGPVVHVAYGEVAGGERVAGGAYADTLVVTVSF